MTVYKNLGLLPCRQILYHCTPRETSIYMWYIMEYAIYWASLMVQTVKNLPAMWETWVQSLGQEDSLEKEMATHSVFLPGESHGRRSLVGYSPWGRKESDKAEQLSTHHPCVELGSTLLHWVKLPPRLQRQPPKMPVLFNTQAKHLAWGKKKK